MSFSLMLEIMLGILTSNVLYLEAVVKEEMGDWYERKFMNICTFAYQKKKNPDLLLHNINIMNWK